MSGILRALRGSAVGTDQLCGHRGGSPRPAPVSAGVLQQVTKTCEGPWAPLLWCWCHRGRGFSVEFALVAQHRGLVAAPVRGQRCSQALLNTNCLGSCKSFLFLFFALSFSPHSLLCPGAFCDRGIAGGQGVPRSRWVPLFSSRTPLLAQGGKKGARKEGLDLSHACRAQRGMWSGPTAPPELL